MGANQPTTTRNESQIKDLVLQTELIGGNNKKIPKKRVAIRTILKKDKVINFMNIPLFVSIKNPYEACEKLGQDLELYEVN